MSIDGVVRVLGARTGRCGRAIVAWNGPLSQITVQVGSGPACWMHRGVEGLAGGAGRAYIVAEIAEEIGLPPGVLNVLTAIVRIGAHGARPSSGQDHVHRLDRGGRKIASILGERIGRFTLELGGKSAAVVLDDYDVDTAAALLSAPRLLVDGPSVLIADSRDHRALPPRRVRRSHGALATPKCRLAIRSTARRRWVLWRPPGSGIVVEGYIAKGIAEGAILAGGGHRPADLERGFFIEPTVFANVDNSSTIAQEEIFGPVTSVIAADNEEHAIEIANDTEFGLASAVFTNDVDPPTAVARQLRAGSIGQNAGRADFGIAFGGFKQSGIGREGGVEGLYPYLETKTVLLAGTPTALADL